MGTKYKDFLSLLRFGIWNTPEDIKLFSHKTDWNGIIEIAIQQSVLNTIVDAINQLPVNNQPPLSVLLKIHTIVMHNIETNANYKRELSEIVKQLKINGINPVLLENNTDINHNTHSSRTKKYHINLYIKKNDLENASFILQSQKIQEGRMEIGLHNNVGHLLYPWRDLYYQHWTKEKLSDRALGKKEINGVSVSVPPIEFNTISSFIHMKKNIDHKNRRLDLLCHWMEYLHLSQFRINKKELKEKLESFGIYKSWLLYNCLAADYFGFPKSETIYYDSNYTNKAKQLLEHIFQ